MAIDCEKLIEFDNDSLNLNLNDCEKLIEFDNDSLNLNLNCHYQI